MKTNLSIFAAVAFSVFSVASQAAPVVSSGLAGSAYSQSSAWNGNSAQTAFNGGGWNSGDFAKAWLQVDLGQVMDLSGLSLVAKRLPRTGFSSFDVYVSNTAIGGAWDQLTAAASYAGSVTHDQALNLNFSGTGRFVELVVVNGNGFGGGNNSWTAVGDVKVFGANPAQVPEPASYALVALALGAAALARRQRRA